MENQTEIIIPIRTEKDRFAQHLQPENNQRIIFSGQFGSGKTYFLEEFFKEHNEYEAFFLSPVHYSVSRNEDVFEYIKYDILINLLMKENVNWDESKVDDQLIAQFFVINKFWSISKELINFLGKTGKLIGTIEGATVGTPIPVAETVISRLSKLKTKYDQYKQEINTNDKSTSIKFMEELSQHTGSIFEYNDITALINSTLNSIDDKKKVLIIDDLDRMDPDHIFRIMNVFAAQFDHERFGYNKFAFDKVIIVCDLDNLRNLFAHKYGSNVDFSGYIDKFYSVEPFNFDNRKALVERTTNIIFSNLSNTHHDYLDGIGSVVKILVKYNIITIRKFISKESFSWNYRSIERYDINSFYPVKSLIFADFLLYLYADQVEDLCHSLEKICDELDYKNERLNQLFFIFPLLLNFSEKNTETVEKTYSISKSNKTISISIDRNSFNIIKINSVKTHDNKEVSLIPYFKLLSECIRNYWELKNDFIVPRY